MIELCECLQVDVQILLMSVRNFAKTGNTYLNQKPEVPFQLLYCLDLVFWRYVNDDHIPTFYILFKFGSQFRKVSFMIQLDC